MVFCTVELYLPSTGVLFQRNQPKKCFMVEFYNFIEPTLSHIALKEI